ncbi:helix-turn-helix domain-containing protein [Saccharopolyspora sp. NPDC000995]
MDAVGADPGAKHNLDALAREAGVSARHFSRPFRIETGMTSGQYVESLRVEAARALLEAGNDPVEAVGKQAGFPGSTDQVAD